MAKRKTAVKKPVKKSTRKPSKKTYSKKTKNKNHLVYKLLMLIVVVVASLAALAMVLMIVSVFIDINPKWKEPTILRSKDGVLDVTLNAKKSNVEIGGTPTQSNVYNGQYIGDTWEVKGGDKIKVRLNNQTSEPTNLHFHGSHVSPKGNSDNVLLDIKPGENFDYEYNLPKDHPPGLYWYHPHMHGFTDDQVGSGMLGAIKVNGDVDNLPGIAGTTEKKLILTTQDTSTTTTRLVNNQLNPTLYVRPLETVRLEIFNSSADDFFNLAIPGHKLNVISRDGNVLSELQAVDNEVMAPGQRVQILFQAPLSGEFKVKSLVYNAGGFTFPEDDFMTIKVAGLPVFPKLLPTKLKPYEDLRNAKIDNVRTLTLSEGGTPQNTTFLIDGKQFNPNIVNQLITLGTTEEWHIINNSVDIHPFHIHVNPFQVTEINGQPVDLKGYQDTYPVPANGSIKIRTKYKDFDGKFVLHCHILFHEDNGMMQVVEVVKPGNVKSPDNGLPSREGMSH